jgi:hypothetical protein
LIFADSQQAGLRPRMLAAGGFGLAAALGAAGEEACGDQCGRDTA